MKAVSLVLHLTFPSMLERNVKRQQQYNLSIDAEFTANNINFTPCWRYDLEKTKRTKRYDMQWLNNVQV